ncbi:3'5'-cyclic nucleotide phosphodiesterase domain-containing protein [Toxoplasma gondii GAB2-2007-GAL-DOM2]|uniref:Phosphodiesterase n=6 Tax=Toxoplasma gondii TaxID=5811 RepID=S7V324_TOXGG|nr:3'5'-cyclic nucleotide phosphodiesterase domain-containing protein [Toxoplasma gondii GT1]KAF4641890.1 3'5'-cyclic nucleotide phosphodiesterase domain-containing protein [Toxoplasma gondii]KFG48776.1 3'5'-cyclic nucleotide phosphodiesterase domain-containing protein [Toxoplasma gondii GAB2-2007-GAL-DOM2]KFG55241.1 3'5'-cyclic nucleotide phosphodiesterase domain-containing protein [Toxoplasma gondii FOU]
MKVSPHRTSERGSSPTGGENGKHRFTQSGALRRQSAAPGGAKRSTMTGFLKAEPNPGSETQDLEATQRRLKSAHRRTMLPTWILTGLSLAYVLFEGGRLLYETTLQQWSEEAILHIDKEIFFLHDFAAGFYSLAEQLTSDYCFLNFMNAHSPPAAPTSTREEVQNLISGYAPSFCSWIKDLYFFEEPLADTADRSTYQLLNTTYNCGERFADLVQRINGNMVEVVQNYTLVKMRLIEMLAPLVDNRNWSPHLLCDLDFSAGDLWACHDGLTALEQLRGQLSGYLGREWHLYSPILSIVIVFILATLFFSRRHAFNAVFHTRFESLWAMLQQIDQVLQRRLENMVVIMQSVIDDRMIGRLKVVSGIQSLLLSSESPAVMRQFYRVMEHCTFELIESLNLASQYVKLEMQSSTEGREMVNIRLLLDGCIQVYRNETRANGTSISCVYAPTVPTALAIDKLRLRTVLLQVLRFALLEGKVTNAEVKLTAKKVFLGKAPSTIETEKRNDLKNFDTQISIKCKMESAMTFSAVELLDSAYLRLRRGKGIGFIYAKKVLRELNGDITITTTDSNEVIYDLYFQAMGRFHVKDFHVAFGTVKNAVALTMNVQQAKGYSQLAAVADLVGVKVIHVTSVAEAVEHMLSNRGHRIVSVFFKDPAGVIRSQLSSALPQSNSRNIPLVEVVAEGDILTRERLEESFRVANPSDTSREVAIEIQERGRRGSTTQGRLLLRESHAFRQSKIVPIEEPLTTSDCVTAMAIGAASFLSNRQASKDLLRNLSYGRRSFWDSLVTAFTANTTRLDRRRKWVNEIWRQVEFDAWKPVQQFRGSVYPADRLFHKVSNMPIQNKYYAYFVAGRINEVGFATNVIDLYKNMVLDQRVYKLPEEKNMSFYELAQTRAYLLETGQKNECLGADYNEDYLGKLLGAQIDPMDTTALVKKVYEEFEVKSEIKVPEEEEPAGQEDELPTAERTTEEFRWGNIPEYTVPSCITASVARMDTVLCLAPSIASEARLNTYRENAPSIAVEFIFSWDFDISSLQPEMSAKLAYELLIWCADKAHISVPRETCEKFVLSVQQNYSAMPFHNFNHALHAAQAVILIAKDLSFQHWFSYEDKFIIMLAALGHDMGHPGVSNEFLISMRSFTSILFNETAVLENYHTLLYMDLLKNSDLDILKMLQPEAVQRARQRIIAAILATDRALDMKLIDLLNDVKSKNEKVPVPAALLDPNVRDACLIHAADHALSLLNFPLHRKWAEKMAIEMHFQNTMDEALKLPKSYCSLSRLTEASLAGSQVTMIDTHYLPFFSALAWYFPGDLDMRVAVMKANAAFWQHLRDEEMRKTVALNDNPEQEDWRSAKLQVISSKFVENREKMHQKAAEMMQAEATDVFFDPYPMIVDQSGNEGEEDSFAKGVMREKSGMGGYAIESRRRSADSSRGAERRESDAEAHHSEATHAPKPDEKSQLDKNGQRQSNSSGLEQGSNAEVSCFQRASLRARFVDADVTIPATKQPVLSETHASATNVTSRGEQGNEKGNLDSPEQTTKIGDEEKEARTDEMVGDPEETREKHDPPTVSHFEDRSDHRQVDAPDSLPEAAPNVGSQNPNSAGTHPDTRATSSVSVPSNVADEEVAERVPAPVPADQSLSRTLLQSDEASQRKNQTKSLSKAESVDTEEMSAFVLDEVSGFFYDQQGYVYDQQGNLRGYLDASGAFQAYSESELQYYAETMARVQDQEQADYAYPEG